MKRPDSEAEQPTCARPPEIREGVNVGIWFSGRGDNMGNERTLVAAIEGLRRFDPDIGLDGISWNPYDAARRHGIDSIPINGRGGKIAAETLAPISNTLVETGNTHLPPVRAIGSIVPKGPC